jgi:hypothetical protein
VDRERLEFHDRLLQAFFAISGEEFTEKIGLSCESSCNYFRAMIVWNSGTYKSYQ